MWISRDISREIPSLARSFPVVVLIGPRQVGKTSLVERVFPDHAYVSLDVGANAELAETRPQGFLGRYPTPLVLDEVQYAPRFFRQIKTTVDARRPENGLFVLTGSQNFVLMDAVADSLAGRAAIIPLLGLSGSEWRAASQISGVWPWQELLWRGGFPALWADPATAPSRDRWYQGYVASYLERDVRNLMNVGSLRDFERFLRACAARCGQTLNMAELGRDVGVSQTTAKQWISVLQASNQILLLEPYYRSLGKRLVKSPKLYFTDTGLAAFLMGFQSADSLWSSPYAGALWETHVVTQWLRWRDWHQPSASLWYWRDRAGHEVDLVIEIGQRLVAIECKLSSLPTERDIGGLAALAKFYGPEAITASFVACTTEEPFDLTGGATAISGWTSWALG